MSNRWYTRVFNAIDGTFARAGAVKNEYTKVEQGFDALQLELDAIRPTWLPASLTGNSLKILRCNVGETAIEFVQPGRLPIVAVAASRNLALTDIGCALMCNSGSAIAITIQPFATVAIPVESAIVLAQMGAGALTLVPGSGVTFRATASMYNARAQFAQITALQIATNEWLIGGDRA